MRAVVQGVTGLAVCRLGMSRRQGHKQASLDPPTISGTQLSVLSAAVAGAVTEALQRATVPVGSTASRNDGRQHAKLRSRDRGGSRDACFCPCLRLMLTD